MRETRARIIKKDQKRFDRLVRRRSADAGESVVIESE